MAGLSQNDYLEFINIQDKYRKLEEDFTNLFYEVARKHSIIRHKNKDKYIPSLSSEIIFYPDHISYKEYCCNGSYDYTNIKIKDLFDTSWLNNLDRDYQEAFRSLRQ